MTATTLPNTTIEAARPKALATLIRLLGDVDKAEEAVQEAIARALAVWPARGEPANAAAWLVTVGRRYSIDGLRKGAREVGGDETIARRAAEQDPEARLVENLDHAVFADDLLRLIFTCCHPALPEPAQVALTLKLIAGLSVDEIARAFLIAPQAMERRLSRAKRNIAEANLAYEVPAVAALPERSRTVLAVVYLIFNEGYNASGEKALIRADLCNEAIRLARLLVRVFSEEAEAMGLLALLLLQHSRAEARLDGAGEAVGLSDQDRSLWDHGLIEEGKRLVEAALLKGPPGTYQIQAAIAAVHADATEAEATDWPQIAELYGILERYQPSPVVTLNRAVALSKAEGPEAAMEMLAPLATSKEMRRFHRYHTVRADLLEQIGRSEEAREAHRLARDLTDNPVERAHLAQKIAGRE
ncbi:MAG: sigma-70 family RNA polymerase sigma factor [Pseudomonadota bacterium]